MMFRSQRQRLLLSQQHGTKAWNPLLLSIFVAFIGGYFVGHNNKTPGRVSMVLSVVTRHDAEVSTSEMLGSLTKIRSKLEREFIKDYETYYWRIFDPLVVDKVFQAGNDSRERLRRKVLMKVLTKLVNPQAKVSFIWASAGDSSAAGHGNHFNQSYTAVLERTVSDAFAALGIDFLGRNYGMSGFGTAPELALCMESVYGSDVDVLSWDFSLMDEQRVNRTTLWGERAGLLQSNPILFMVDSRSSGRFDALQRMEKQGMGTILMDKETIDILRTRMPRHSDPHVPPALEYFMCDGAVEGNVICDDPKTYFVCDKEDAKECVQHKYKIADKCDRSVFQKPWHPGWKEHLFRGRLIGHFLLATLEDVLTELHTMKHGIMNPHKDAVRSSSILEMMQGLDDADRTRRHAVALDELYSEEDKEVVSAITARTLYRRSAVCRTALLPSETRYLGIAVDSPKVGNYTGGYYLGVNRKHAFPRDGFIPLAYDTVDRKQCTSPKIDHKDFFLVRESLDWVTTYVPNVREIEAYWNPYQPLPEGIFIVCLAKCPRGGCQDGYIGLGEEFDDAVKGKLKIKVDGEQVARVRRFDGCHVLERDNGSVRWSPGRNENGQYQLDFQIHVKGSGDEHTVQISSIILL